MNFKVMKIKDLCVSICSGGTPKSSETLYYKDGTIPWLTTSEVNFKDIYSTQNKITKLGLEKSSATNIPINCVIVAMYGVTAGRVAINKIELTTNQACCNLQIDEKIANYRYIYYYLKMQSNDLNRLANGGAQQNLNSIVIKKYKVLIPKIESQNRIAKTLENYDSLIENNNRRIKLLETMAEELYKEWFVRFRFPNSKKETKHRIIPKGWVYGNNINGLSAPKSWNYKKLNYFGEFVRGKNITSEEMKDGNIEVISAGLEPSGFHNEYNVEGYSLTISASGANAGYLSYHLNDIWAADCSYYNGDNIWFIYHSLNFIKSVIDNLQVGSAQPHVYAKNVNKLSIIASDNKMVKEFENKMKYIYGEIKILNNKNKLLIQQRDYLLPRLMSGKLSVENKNII